MTPQLKSPAEMNSILVDWKCIIRATEPRFTFKDEEIGEVRKFKGLFMLDRGSPFNCPLIVRLKKEYDALIVGDKRVIISFLQHFRADYMPIKIKKTASKKARALIKGFAFEASPEIFSEGFLKARFYRQL
jgi:hypothetical protein